MMRLSAAFPGRPLFPFSLERLLHVRAPVLALLLASLMTCSPLRSQAPERYTNPILFADYSDPDMIRDGRDYYLIASSFHFSPGLPILHSRDMVHWELAGHALARLPFAAQYNMQGGTRYASGVWAPSVRSHNGLFYLYFPTPDEGIFMMTAPHMTGPWSQPVAVLAGPGWEDPCPFWDDDGNAYLVHSRLHAGPLILHRMSADGRHLLDEGKTIVSDPQLPTLEGPKIYKRNGWYYIWAPFGGVGRGAQTVLRAKNLYGPWEHRTVLAQGSSAVNGPHQGAYVETPDGRGYFLHFQLRESHGRIVHLEPVTWKDDWPIVGDNGIPVASAEIPVAHQPHYTIQTSDDFSAPTLQAMWEWNHNPDDAHWSLRKRAGFLRLEALPAPDLLHARNTLTECPQDESYEVTTSLDASRLAEGDRAGLSLFDRSTSYIAVARVGDHASIVMSSLGKDVASAAVGESSAMLLRAAVHGNLVTYAWSDDAGAHFHPLGEPLTLAFSWWKGARPALFAFHQGTETSGGGYADFDFLHYSALDTAR